MMLRGEKEREELQNELDKTRTNLRYGFIEPQVIKSENERISLSAEVAKNR